MKYLFTLFIANVIVVVSAQNYNYLGTYKSDGTPNYLIDPSDNVSIETQELISGALPESFPVPDYNPHYISSGYDTDLHLNDSADVWVTFVSEGAGYRNVLGFYTYNSQSPGTSAPTRNEITIIFPNVSALGSGGGLQIGDKVKIGSFSAGTSIGWVLLANGWQNGRVTSGQWQVFSNPDYNPENDPSLSHHNVLLADPENERIILGFEDIRRDYASCDNDFNDAIFYVTANPFEAIITNNLTDISTATDVTSANSGGLESNGTLAEKIALRNFTRGKNHSQMSDKSNQINISDHRLLFKSSSLNNLEQYIPSSGMFGTEVAKVSSPTDLVDITNAKEVFSVDYYIEDSRVAAALATYSEGTVYDHSKAICDRLNNSSLLDVRTVVVRGHEMITSRIERPNGEIENALSFSIKTEGNLYHLFSLWNIDQYPAGDYFNFQIWGANYAQVFAIANQIIDKFASENNVISDSIGGNIPGVFVQSGYYVNGKVHLNLLNKNASLKVTVNGNFKSTEQAGLASFQQTITLNGDRYETIEVKTGSIFDVGISLVTEDANQMDALYLADGPWGMDYSTEAVRINNYTLNSSTLIEDLDKHYVERNLSTTGEIKNTFNVFRQVLPGDQTFELSNYKSLSVTISSSHPIEVILMQENLENWEDRFSYFVPATRENTAYQIPIHAFADKNGNQADINNVKRIVFSMNGNGQSYETFGLSVSNVVFGNETYLNASTGIKADYEEITNIFPNPFSSNATIQLNESVSSPVIKVYDNAGRVVDQQTISTMQGSNSIVYTNRNLQSGMYYFVIEDNHAKKQKGQFVIAR